MNDIPRLKDDYTLAKCCAPRPGDDIAGFLKFDSTIISVHAAGCVNLAKVERDRLVALTWDEIIDNDPLPDLSIDRDYRKLDDIDFGILKHHMKMGNDYAAVVAKMTHIPRATVFERHKKLRQLNLIRRVEPVMMQYRKGIVKNKWIKHRNHTYYDITPQGILFLQWYLNKDDRGKGK
ncbi:MAG: DUF2250 domain-containing protein [candidate division Zixibacteria bacterium]|nr:DUF2250 domain-containing protein [candidate division Zixibacteria bacterium]